MNNLNSNDLASKRNKSMKLTFSKSISHIMSVRITILFKKNSEIN
jgi:hypothetical protein